MLRVLGLLFLIAMTGCATVTMKSPGRHEIGSSYTITTSRSWSHIAGPPESWTIDGPSLGVLRTWADLEDGDRLFVHPQQTLPQFRSDFSTIEVAEMVADTMEALTSGADVETSGFRPVAFGSNNGFRFEISYVENGLPYRGTAAGAIRGGSLDLLLFTAPAEYYFDRHAPEIETIFLSVKTTA